MTVNGGSAKSTPSATTDSGGSGATAELQGSRIDGRQAAVDVARDLLRVYPGTIQSVSSASVDHAVVRINRAGQTWEFALRKVADE